MGKDPAFLFYSDNFMSGTMFFDDEQVGKYIRLLCAQHLTGHLSEKHMLNICKTYDKDIWLKFVQDKEGNFYNERLEFEILRRKNYSESRRNNRKSTQNQKVNTKKHMSNISLSYEKHMGNEIENENEIEDDTIKGGVGGTENFEKIEHPYLTKIKTDHKMLLKMKEPLTEEEAGRLEIDIGDKLVYDLLERMSNWKKLITNNVSVNKTLRSWHNNDQKKINQNGKPDSNPKSDRIGRLSRSSIENILSRPPLVVPKREGGD